MEYVRAEVVIVYPTQKSRTLYESNICVVRLFWLVSFVSNAAGARGAAAIEAILRTNPGTLRWLGGMDLGSVSPDLPLELKHASNEAILEYYRDLRSTSSAPRLCRVILLGAGGAGKTCLANRLGEGASSVSSHGASQCTRVVFGCVFSDLLQAISCISRCQSQGCNRQSHPSCFVLRVDHRVIDHGPGSPPLILDIIDFGIQVLCYLAHYCHCCLVGFLHYHADVCSSLPSCRSTRERIQCSFRPQPFTSSCTAFAKAFLWPVYSSN